MVDGTRFAVIRPRPTIEEMLSAERFPPWMEPVKAVAKGRRWTPARPPTIEAPGLRRKIGLAWAALAWEGLWPRLVPLLAYRGAVRGGRPSRPLRRPRSLGPYRPAGGCWRSPWSVSAGGELRDFAWPAREAAIRRLERDSGVPHRPLVAVQDRLAAGSDDPMAAALWEAHRRREAERLAGLSNKPAHPGLASARHLGAALRAGAGC